MRKIALFIGAALLIQGAAGLVYEALGWFRFWVVVRHLDFLDGYEVVANVALVVVGLLLVFLGYEEES